MSHSIIAPSSAHVWVHCTGFPVMSLQVPPQPDTEESREGDAAHWLGERMIVAASRGGSRPSRELTVGTFDPAGTLISEKIFDGAEIYADHCISLMRTASVFSLGSHMGVEDKIECPEIHPLNNGTSDFWVFDQHAYALHVVDAKFGWGIVEAFENWQEINYTSGIISRLKLNGIDDQHLTVILWVVQPNAFHENGSIRKWIVKASDLRAYFNKLQHSAHEAFTPSAKLVAGKHCRYCPALHVCPQSRNYIYDGGDYLHRPLPDEMSSHAIGLELRNVRRIYELAEWRYNALTVEVENRLRKGESVPFHRMGEKRGSLKWKETQSNEKIFAFGAVLGVDFKKSKPVTPLQARDLLLSKGVDPDLINSITERTSGGFKLVEDNGNKAREVFGQ